MSQEILLENLRRSTSIEQKAAVVAEYIVQDLSPRENEIAIWCGLLPWFSEKLIGGMLGTTQNDTTIQKIINLPFVEKISPGYCFHTTTRKGLLRKYRYENPLEIQKAFEAAQIFQEADSDFNHVMYTLYGYVITNQGLKAESLLYDLLDRGEIHSLDQISPLDEAEEFCLSDGIGLTPNYWFYRGNVSLIGQDYEAVVAFCNKALSLDKNFYKAYSILSLAKFKLGFIDEAFHDINLAINAQPDGSLYRSRGLLYMFKKDYKNSIFDFTRALRYNPQDVQAYAGRADAYLASKKNEKAFKDLDVMLALSKDDKTRVFAYTLYARALIVAKEYERALVFLDKVVQIEPNTGSYRRKGNILFSLDRFKEAAECYEKSIELDTKNPYAYLGRGKLYLQEGKFQEALSNFNKACSFPVPVNPMPLNGLDIKEVNLRLWETYLKLDDPDNVEKQKSILLNTKNEAELLEILFFCRKYRFFDVLLLVSKKLIENQNISSPSYTPIGYGLNQIGDYQGALVYLLREEKKSDSSPISKINIGISYWGLEDYKRAIEYFEAANKDFSKLPKQKKFSSSPKRSKTDFSGTVWLKAILGNYQSALHSIDEYLQSTNIEIDEFYDLRDWGAVVKRFPQKLPVGFQEFYDRIINILSDIDSNSIYKLNSGI